MGSLTACVLRTERAQLGLPYRQNRVATQLVAAALRRFVALPYLAQNDPQAAAHAEDVAAAGVRQAICSATRGVSRDGWTFAERKPPATVKPLELARLVAKLFQAPDAVSRSASAVFGVASRRGRLFEHDAARGISVGIVAVNCP